MDEIKNLRFWEIDFFRGIAIIMMIVFHVLYDMNYFGGYAIDLHSGFWWAFARMTASIFILLVGVSLAISFSKVRKVKTKEELRKKYLMRGLKILSWGIIITIMTWLFLSQGFIIFGILHFIGFAIILAYPFLRYRYFNLLTGLAFIIIGIYLASFTFSFPWLLWLGFMPEYFYTIDYFPIFPWFGLILIGLFFGNSLYQDGIRKFIIRDISNLLPIRLFCFLGRNSLLIYLIHQPILIALLYAFIL